MIKNRFEVDSGAYHFAREDLLDFADIYGLDTIVDDIIAGYETRKQNKLVKERREQQKYMEFGAHYD